MHPNDSRTDSIFCLTIAVTLPTTSAPSELDWAQFIKVFGNRCGQFDETYDDQSILAITGKARSIRDRNSSTMKSNIGGNCGPSLNKKRVGLP